MTLRELVLWLFKRCFTGKDNPIKIINLCLILNEGETDPKFWTFSKREIRQSYEGFPVCGTSRGLYLLETKPERKKQIALHWSKIYAYFRKIDVLERYKIPSDSVQKELF